jgi:hypothetical protein
MNKREKVLAARMLDMAGGEFGNRGCNDLDESVYEGWTKRQRQAFVKAYHEWNGDPEEYNPEWLDLPDFAIMGFLADKLLEGVE